MFNFNRMPPQFGQFMQNQLQGIIPNLSPEQRQQLPPWLLGAQPPAQPPQQPTQPGSNDFRSWLRQHPTWGSSIAGASSLGGAIGSFRDARRDWRSQRPPVQMNAPQNALAQYFGRRQGGQI